MNPSDDVIRTARALAQSERRVPADVRDALDGAVEAEFEVFDSSYLEFLDEQIRLNARGDHWTTVLSQRRAALAPLAGERLLRLTVRLSTGSASLRFTTDPLQWVHCEVET
jgi:hypothetical protein